VATTLTATLSLDLTAAQTQWTAAKNAAKALPDKVQAVQATLSSITVSGTPGAAGTFTFTVSDAQTVAALADLLTAEQTLHDAIVQTQAQLAALVPTVTGVV
jgi:hypothetical protein